MRLPDFERNSSLRDVDRDRTHGRPILNRVKTLVSARPLPSTEAGDGRGRLPPQSVRLDAAMRPSSELQNQGEGSAVTISFSECSRKRFA